MNLAATMVTKQKSYVHLTTGPPVLASALTGQCLPDLVAIPKMAPGNVGAGCSGFKLSLCR